MKILIAASEAIPYAKTGGLADVTGSLLKEYGKISAIETYLILPLYSGIQEKFCLVDTGISVKIPIGPRWYGGKIWSHGSSVYFVECSELFGRPELYGTSQGDYPDNAKRFAFFSRAVLETCMSAGLKPDIIHCNDWQTALIPLYRETLYNNDFFSKTMNVLTIHNVGYQGLFDASDLSSTGLGSEWFTPEGIEFYGRVNFLKGGLVSADILTTVSDTYAREILTPEYGYGLDGVLRKRSSDLYGVLNGIDTEEWDPWKDPHVPSNYRLSDIAGKAVCKRRLLQECSLDPGLGNAPLVAIVGRLSQQKGLDILLESVDDIISMGVGLVIFGKGDETRHARVLEVAERHQGTAFVKIGYDESLAHRIYAGSDMFLMPSRYEPCGLGQLIAMKYGTIPVARKTGGLADTISDYDPSTDFGTGFLFEEYGAASLKACVKRALRVFAERERWKHLIVRAMGMDFSWESSAKKYVELFGRALETKRPTG